MTASILIVDDTPANLRLMQNKLKAGFYQADTAETGEEALEILGHGKHGIVLLDVMMPGIDGFEVCRRIKSNAKTQQISVVMVTSLNDTQSRIKGLEAGADDFISRPVQDDVLFSRIRSLERLGRLMQQVNLRTKTTKRLGFDKELPNLQEIDFGSANILLSEPDSQLAKQICQWLEEDLNAILHFSQVESGELDFSNQSLEQTIELLLLNADHDTENDGIHAAISFGSAALTRNTPVVLLFDQQDTNRIEAALQAGISDYAIANVDRSELVARVKTQLKRHRYLKQLDKLYEASISMALTDSLTGLYSRRYASQHLPDLVREADQAGQSITLLIIDTDNFKSINDMFGHEIGDLVLKKVAKCLKQNLRDVDLIARWGGDEFVAVLPDCDLSKARIIADRLANVISELDIRHGENRIDTSVSIGGSSTSTYVIENTDWLDLLRQADRALYDTKARHKGRAKIV